MYIEDLRIEVDMFLATLAKIEKKEIVSMDVLTRICEILECYAVDIESYL